MPVAAVEIIYRPVGGLNPYEGNTRTHTGAQITSIANSIREFGFINPILLKDDGKTIGAGHARALAAVQAGLDQVPTITLHGLSEAQWRAYVIADNRLAETGSGWDEALLAQELTALADAGVDMLLTGFNSEEIDRLLHPPESTEDIPRVSLQDRFGAVPFSVLNAREGWWQGRKKAWLALGIASELGRGENALGFSDTILNNGKPSPAKASNDGAKLGAGGLADQVAAAATARKGKGAALAFGQDLMKGEHVVGGNPETSSLKGGLTFGTSMHPFDATGERRNNDGLTIGQIDGQPGHPRDAPPGAGTSIFDPVLAELNYRWFCPPGGTILDPFAGGSVRGIVASKVGRGYIGCELRPEQVAANIAQADQICAMDANPPAWLVGDSRKTLSDPGGPKHVDFIFSCPPYGDLEVYSDDPADLSNMPYDDFIRAYRDIIAASVSRLKRDRFASFVVGDIRDKQGLYRNFVSDTISAFVDAGARLYNEAILITAAGSLPIRAGKQFAATRKLGKTHQNVLIFVKGDPQKATVACGEVEFGQVPESGGEIADVMREADDAEFGEVL